MASKIKGRQKLLHFKFGDFFEWLAESNKLVESRYYLGAVKQEKKNKKSQKLYAKQQKLFSALDRQGIILSLGKIIRHPDKTYHEKGVDVKLAVEMIKFARQDKYDIAYLLSSDTDLVPAVKEVHFFGKEVQYVGIAHGQSWGLSKVCDDVRLLRAKEIEKFF